MTSTSTNAPRAHITRRSMLAATATGMAAAAVAIPAAAVAGPIATTSRAAWDQGMQRLIDADAACKDYDRRVWTPAYDREHAFEASHGLEHGKPGYWERRKELLGRHDYAMPEAVSDEYERRVTAFCVEEDALMEMPAPDASALRWKLDKLLEPESDGSTASWSRDYVRQTVADYQRLLRGPA